MSDDAAQDKTTEDEAITKADAVAPGSDADKSAEAETTKIPAPAVAAEAPAEAAKPDFAKKSDAEPEAPKAPKAAAAIPGTAKSGGPFRGNPLVPVIAAAAAGVVAIAAIATAVVLWKQSDDRKQDLGARDGAASAACSFGKAVSNYDAKNLDSYFNGVKDLSTGEWLTFFNSASDTLKQAMTSVQAKSTLDEIHCAWESGDDKNAKVVLILTQVRSNAVVATPDMLTVPGIADMVNVDGQWKVAKFDSPAMKSLAGPSGGSPAPSTAPAPAPAPAPGN